MNENPLPTMKPSSPLFLALVSWCVQNVEAEECRAKDTENGKWNGVKEFLILSCLLIYILSQPRDVRSSLTQIASL